MNTLSIPTQARRGSIDYTRDHHDQQDLLDAASRLSSPKRYPWGPEVANKFPRLPSIGSNLTFQLVGSHRGRYGAGPVLCSWYDIKATPWALVLPTRLTHLFLKRVTGPYEVPEVVFAVSLPSRSCSTSRRWKGQPWDAWTLHVNCPDPEWKWTDGIVFAHPRYDTLPGMEELRATLRTENKKSYNAPDSY